MAERKVIFLDFDGVLNNTSSLLYWQRIRNKGLASPDPISVVLVDRLIEASGAEVVVSSSWRQGKDVKTIQSILRKEFGLVNWSRVTGRTREHNYNKRDMLTLDRLSTMTEEEIADYSDKRGHQIQDWLDANPDVTHYVILDDDSDMLPSQKEANFVQTSHDHGFKVDEFERAGAILGLTWKQLLAE